MSTLSYRNGTEELQRVIRELAVFLSETAAYHKADAIRGVLQEAIGNLRVHDRRLQQSKKRYVVALVGLTNVGKSTLLNALLGRNLAPRKSGPCTSVPVEFVQGDSLSVTAYRCGSVRRQRRLCNSDDEVHEALGRLAVEGGGEQDVERIEVAIPGLPYPKELVIADTPGFGAAQLDASRGTHEQAVRTYIQQEATQVFWVVASQQGITQRECDFYRKCLSGLCDDLLVTGCEEWTQQDQQHYKRVYAGALDRRLLNVLFVSGKQGIVARKMNDRSLLEQAGIVALEERWGKLAHAAGRLSSILSDVESLASDIGAWMVRNSVSRANGWGRPDSWNRWSAFIQTSTMGASVNAALRSEHA